MNNRSDDRERDVLRLVRGHLEKEADGTNAAAVAARIMHTRAARRLRARAAFIAAALAASIAVLVYVTRPQPVVHQPMDLSQLAAIVHTPGETLASGTAIGLDAARECVRQAANLKHIIPSRPQPRQPSAGGGSIDMLKFDAKAIGETVNRLIMQSLSDAGLKTGA